MSKTSWSKSPDSFGLNLIYDWLKLQCELSMTLPRPLIDLAMISPWYPWTTPPRPHLFLLILPREWGCAKSAQAPPAVGLHKIEQNSIQRKCYFYLFLFLLLIIYVNQSTGCLQWPLTFLLVTFDLLLSALRALWSFWDVFVVNITINKFTVCIKSNGEMGKA